MAHVPAPDFDLVTVSVNYQDEKAGVMRLLNEQHASSRNLQFATEDTYGLQAAFEPKWNAGVSFTMVICRAVRWRIRSKVQ